MTKTAYTTIVHHGTHLRRQTETGPRGGRSYLYQAVSASPVWGYWYDTATPAAETSNASDRVVSA